MPAVDLAHPIGTAASRWAPPFRDWDLYLTVLDLTVLDLNGKVLAHGLEVHLIGQVLIDLMDPDGKLFMRERITLARRQPSFW